MNTILPLSEPLPLISRLPEADYCMAAREEELDSGEVVDAW